MTIDQPVPVQGCGGGVETLREPVTPEERPDEGSREGWHLHHPVDVVDGRGLVVKGSNEALLEILRDDLRVRLEKKLQRFGTKSWIAAVVARVREVEAQDPEKAYCPRLHPGGVGGGAPRVIGARVGALLGAPPPHEGSRGARLYGRRHRTQGLPTIPLQPGGSVVLGPWERPQ